MKVMVLCRSSLFDYFLLVFLVGGGGGGGKGGNRETEGKPNGTF